MTATGPYADATALKDHWWWRPGWQIGTRFYTWHLTVEDQPALRGLIAQYQAALRDEPTVDVVPEQWLHLTTQGIGHVSEVSEEDRDAIVQAVRTRLAGVQATPLTFHRAVVHSEAVVIPPTDPKPLHAVRRAIREGIADVWGAELVPESAEGFRPHVSVAYANVAGAPARLRRRLDQVDVAPVTASFRTASLIVLHRDRRMYEWTTSAVADIGAAST